MEDLSKSDKRNAREIIKKGMHEEFRRGMESFYSLLENWRKTKNEDQEHYAELYGAVREFDKQIARRYDGLRNSMLEFVLIAQLKDGLITDADLEPLSAELKQYITRWIKESE